VVVETPDDRPKGCHLDPNNHIKNGEWYKEQSLGPTFLPKISKSEIHGSNRNEKQDWPDDEDKEDGQGGDGLPQHSMAECLVKDVALPPTQFDGQVPQIICLQNAKSSTWNRPHGFCLHDVVSQRFQIEPCCTKLRTSRSQWLWGLNRPARGVDAPVRWLTLRPAGGKRDVKLRFQGLFSLLSALLLRFRCCEYTGR